MSNFNMNDFASELFGQKKEVRMEYFLKNYPQIKM